MNPDAEAFYEPDGDGYRATALTRGPWDPGAQHAGPPSALLGREVEATAGDTGRVARISMEILRPVPIGPVRTSAEVVRPGRRVALVAGGLEADGVEVMRATAWVVREQDIGAQSPPLQAPPGDPEAAEPEAFFLEREGEPGWDTAMDIRFAAGAFTEPGPAMAWLRMRVALVAGEEPSPLSRVLAAADAGNGISATLDFRTHLFVNTDLTVHLHRHPVGPWVGLDAETVVDRDGIGLATSAIADAQGWIGRGAQALYVAPR